MLCVAYGVEGDEFHYIMCNYLNKIPNIVNTFKFNQCFPSGNITYCIRKTM